MKGNTISTKPLHESGKIRIQKKVCATKDPPFLNEMPYEKNYALYDCCSFPACRGRYGHPASIPSLSAIQPTKITKSEYPNATNPPTVKAIFHQGPVSAESADTRLLSYVEAHKLYTDPVEVRKKPGKFGFRAGEY